MLPEYGIENTNEARDDASQTIDIDVEAGIEIDEIEAPPIVDNVTELQNVQNNTDYQESDENTWNCSERIVSKYSQEESTIEYPSSAIPHVTPSANENDIPADDIEIQNTTAGDTEIEQLPENSQQLDNANIVDIDNYMSSHAGTSSSHRMPTLPPYPSRCYDPKTGEIIIARIEKTVNHPKVRLFFSLSLEGRNRFRFIVQADEIFGNKFKKTVS